MDGKDNNSLQVVSLKRRGFLRTRIANLRSRGPQGKGRLYAILTVAAILLGSVGWLVYQRESEISKNICNGRNSNKFYAQLAPNLSSYQYRELEKQVKTIVRTKDFQKDPNCLYAVTQYYIVAGDSTNAKEYYGRFEKVYNPQKGLVEALSKKSASIEKLKRDLAGLEQSAKQFKDNMILSN